jgi:ubiquinone/menaquinone biosynthesis C-methylase UbiE
MTDRSESESYTHGYSEEFRKYHGSRTARIDADFFVSHLRPGMRLLDCGCGPGSITLGLAEIVAPGEVIGVDIAYIQLDAARRLAAERSTTNVRFERGDVYALPYPDNSFDAAFANHVIEHLSDPVRALKEIRRVLKQGGVIGMRNDDWSGTLLEPSTPLRTEGLQLFLRVAEHNGARLRDGRYNRRFLREAGFVRTEGYGWVVCSGTREQTRQTASLVETQFRDPAFVATAVSQGWASQATLEAIIADYWTWSEDPDAYWAHHTPMAIGWVPDNK